jgi:hypothetical protein
VFVDAVGSEDRDVDETGGVSASENSYSVSAPAMHPVHGSMPSGRRVHARIGDDVGAGERSAEAQYARAS